MTEHLALALCVQLAEDYASLMSRLGVNETLSPRTFRKAKMYVGPQLIANRNAMKLRESILRNYETHLKFLEEKKYG